MNIQHNPPRRSALVWIGVIAVGIIIIFIPRMIGMDGFGGGFALSFLGGFVSLIGVIAAVIYFRLAATLDRITQKENVLAHWQYAPAEWKIYSEKEHREDTGGRRTLFLMIVAITVLVGLVFWAALVFIGIYADSKLDMQWDKALIILLVCLGIIAVTGLTAWITGLTNYRHNKASLGEVFIARDGAYLNRQLHIWNGIGARLEEIVFENDDQARPRIRVEYSAPNRASRNFYTARIPVPDGQEETAKKIVAEIAAANRSPSGEHTP